jgi:hypothetical protein
MLYLPIAPLQTQRQRTPSSVYHQRLQQPEPITKRSPPSLNLSAYSLSMSTITTSFNTGEYKPDIRLPSPMEMPFWQTGSLTERTQDRAEKRERVDSDHCRVLTFQKTSQRAHLPSRLIFLPLIPCYNLYTYYHWTLSLAFSHSTLVLVCRISPFLQFVLVEGTNPVVENM